MRWFWRKWPRWRFVPAGQPQGGEGTGCIRDKHFYPSTGQMPTPGRIDAALYGETKQDMEKIIRQMSREELDDLLVVLTGWILGQEPDAPGHSGGPG